MCVSFTNKDRNSITAHCFKLMSMGPAILNYAQKNMDQKRKQITQVFRYYIKLQMQIFKSLY